MITELLDAFSWEIPYVKFGERVYMHHTSFVPFENWHRIQSLRETFFVFVGD